ncbi:MAG: glycosyl transferase [Treponema sp.]|nr:glycosyl transferase [Treponema sp.]
MKIVYVLTSSQDDHYYEQFFLSVVSLRLYNPGSHVIALIDSITKENLKGKRSGYEQYVTETIIITAPGELSQKEVSRWIKTSINNYVSGDFLYIDCDTVISGVIEYDFPSEINIGAILDTHVPLSKHHLALHFEDEDKKLKFTSSFETGKRYNGGVIFCRYSQECNEFFSRWHSLWMYSNKNGNHHDMPALNQANHEMGGIIKELYGEWNCQITHNGLPFLYNARIIHYYATAFNFIECPYLPGSRAVLSSVKDAGYISPQVMELLKNPKTAFEPGSRIISGAAELDAVNSKYFSLILRIRKKTPKFFKAVNSFFFRILSFLN